MKIKKLKLIKAVLLTIIASMILSSIPLVQASNPSTVSGASGMTCTEWTCQRKTFYANGLIWVFWGGMSYSTSADGESWSSPTNIRSSTGQGFSVWHDGTYVYYACAVNGVELHFRRGTTNSSGGITWSAAEQTVPTTYNLTFNPYVSVDSNGYVWISYVDKYESNLYHPYIIKNDNKDGTWSTNSSFPYQLSTDSAFPATSIIPLTNGKMLALYGTVSSTLKAKAWNGSAWGSEASTGSTLRFGEYYSAVAEGDNVHVVFLKDSPHDVVYTQYNYTSNSFGTETVIQASSGADVPPVISLDPTTNNLYVFWYWYPLTEHIYYKIFSGTWGEAVDWIDESAGYMPQTELLSSFYNAGGNFVGLEYMTSPSGVDQVRFAYLDLTAPSPTPTPTPYVGGGGSSVTPTPTPTPSFSPTNPILSENPKNSDTYLVLALAGAGLVAVYFMSKKKKKRRHK